MQSPCELGADEQTVLDALLANYDKDYHHRQGVYKDLLLRWHPDKHPHETELATSVFALRIFANSELTSAFNVRETAARLRSSGSSSLR